MKKPSVPGRSGHESVCGLAGFVPVQQMQSERDARVAEASHWTRLHKKGAPERTEDCDRFLSLQMTWIRLVLELDQAGALIKAMQELDEEPPIKATE